MCISKAMVRPGRRPSIRPRDPTPTEPVALALAAADPAPAVAYLGRPCQYLEAAELAACSPEYWTNRASRRRWSQPTWPSSIGSRRPAARSRLRLFGYSGGGVLATLLAARRGDVEQLVTVACAARGGRMDVLHQADAAARIARSDRSGDGAIAAGDAFVGGRDRIVPSRLVAVFAARTGGTLNEVPDFDHQCCWSRDWRRLLEEIK
jgi:hypothetical protein